MLANTIVRFAQDLENMPILASLTQVTGTLASMSLSRATVLEQWRMLCLIHHTRRNKHTDNVEKFCICKAIKKWIKSSDRHMVLPEPIFDAVSCTFNLINTLP
jgi:hypothetical protein